VIPEIDFKINSLYAGVMSTAVPARDASPPVDAADLGEYARGLESWLTGHPEVLELATRPTIDLGERVQGMTAFMARLYGAGWSRYGWSSAYGGYGGGLLHRAAMWDALARHGVPGMLLFEQIEVLMPTMVALGPAERVQTLLPKYLAGEQLWCQGFSEPGAGSDLASLRTRAEQVDGGFVVTGRKIWTSWAPWARWCLVLARTGPLESRHRGVTALIVDMESAGVDVQAITMANGNGELAEVTFDDVRVPADALVGDLHGGWKVAMHILSSERGSFAWFRHGFLYQQLRRSCGADDPRSDRQLGDAVLDLFTVTAKSHLALVDHDGGAIHGPRAAFTKLLLCRAERSACDVMLADHPEIAFDADDPEIGTMRQEYLFSRIVSVYGGSEQMQLHTIAKQVLGLS
jgi:alkylation response protein AidB-like acyl-CoA dehydrogenase